MLDFIKSKSVLGIQLSPFPEKPIFKIHRFLVFEVAVPGLPPEYKRRNLNYQIESKKMNERIVLRIYFNKAAQIMRSRYYYSEEVDDELAYYLAMSVLTRLSKEYSFHEIHKLEKVAWA